MASAGCWNALVVTGSATEEVAEFIILSAKSGCCLMLLESAHTSCQSARKNDPQLECAPVGGQDQAADLTVCRAW
jgi:hypothetical protein